MVAKKTLTFEEAFESIIKDRNGIKKVSVIIRDVLLDDYVSHALRMFIETVNANVNDDWEYLTIQEDLQCHALASYVNMVLHMDQIYYIAKKVKKKPAYLSAADLRNQLLKNIDNAGLLKWIEYRLEESVFINNETSILEHVNMLIRYIRTLRNDFQGHNTEVKDSIAEENPYVYFDKLKQLIEPAAKEMRNYLKNGQECAEIFDDLKEKLGILESAYRLSQNGKVISANDTEKYSWRDIYAYEIFMAYPSFEPDSYIFRFAQTLIRKRKCILLDSGTVDYIDDIMHGRDEARKGRAIDFAKSLKMESEYERLCRTISVNSNKSAYDNIDEHFTEAFYKFLKKCSTNPKTPKMCIITDNEYLARKIWSLGCKNIIAVKCCSEKHVIAFKDKAPVQQKNSVQQVSVKNVQSMQGSEIIRTTAARAPEVREQQESIAEPQNKRAIEQKKPKAEEVKEINLPIGSLVTFDSTEGSTLLTKELSRGGEGVVYKTDNGKTCIKIYSKTSAERNEKLRFMMDANIKFSTTEEKGEICWPTRLITHPRYPGEIIGFEMKLADKAISLEQLRNELISNVNRWGWNQIDLVELCKNIMDTFLSLHHDEPNPKVLMGDVNEKNILVTENKKVYFIDVDSYQVKDKYCTVGTPEYTSPRLYRKGCKFSEEKRTVGDERFAIAHLLFYILMLGDTPYSTDINYTLKDCIIKKRYRYYNDSSKKNRHNFKYRNLSQRVQKAFMDVFSSTDKHDHPELYPDDRSWHEMLCEMENQIKDARLSNELFPTSALYDDEDNFITVKCEDCGDSFESTKKTLENEFEAKMCPKCKLKRNINRSDILRLFCKKCGRYYTVNRWDIHETAKRIKDEAKKGNTNEPALACPDCNGMYVPKSKEYDKPGKASEFLRRALRNAAEALQDDII